MVADFREKQKFWLRIKWNLQYEILRNHAEFYALLLPCTDLLNNCYIRKGLDFQGTSIYLYWNKEGDRNQALNPLVLPSLKDFMGIILTFTQNKVVLVIDSNHEIIKIYAPSNFLSMFLKEKFFLAIFSHIFIKILYI